MAKQNYKSIVPFVSELLPDFISENESLFVDFLEAYFEWLEEESNTQDLFFQLESLQDVDKSLANFYEYFRREFMQKIPSDIQTNPELTFKHIRDLYKAKGTEQATKLLFKILFNENIIIDYPGDRILKPSDGIWVTRTYLRTEDNVTDLSEFVGRQIVGNTSKAYAVVESVFSRDVDGTVVHELNISDRQGFFEIGEVVATFDNDPVVMTTLSGMSNSYAITNAGTGYTEGTELTLTNAPGDTGTGADIRISSVGTSGEILSLNIVDPGYGYEDPPTVDLSGLGNGDATVTFGVGGLFESDGYFRNVQGFLSDIIVLQDGGKYQNYSYAIKSSRAINEWRNIVKDLTHPAGIFLSGEVKVVSTPDEILGGQLGLYRILGIDYNDPDEESSRKFFEPFINIFLDANVALQHSATVNQLDTERVDLASTRTYFLYTNNDFDSYGHIEFQTFYDAYGNDMEIYEFNRRYIAGSTHVTTDTP